MISARVFFTEIKKTLSPKKGKRVFYDPRGNRTPVTAVKGRCLNRLTIGPERAHTNHLHMVAEIGLEPMTYRV